MRHFIKQHWDSLLLSGLCLALAIPLAKQLWQPVTPMNIQVHSVASNQVIDSSIKADDLVALTSTSRSAKSVTTLSLVATTPNSTEGYVSKHTRLNIKKKPLKHRKTKANLPAHSVHLNSANSSQLQRLPGIGPKLAGRVIEYRQHHGPFQQVTQLVKVKGVGKKTLTKLSPYLSL